jgi:hypothetical protein
VRAGALQMATAKARVVILRCLKKVRVKVDSEKKEKRMRFVEGTV